MATDKLSPHTVWWDLGASLLYATLPDKAGRFDGQEDRADAFLLAGAARADAGFSPRRAWCLRDAISPFNDFRAIHNFSTAISQLTILLTTASPPTTDRSALQHVRREITITFASNTEVEASIMIILAAHRDKIALLHRARLFGRALKWVTHLYFAIDTSLAAHLDASSIICSELCAVIQASQTLFFTCISSFTEHELIDTKFPGLMGRLSLQQEAYATSSQFSNNITMATTG